LTRFSRPEPQTAAYIFSSIFGLTIAVYVLRGFGILAFIPGGIIWLLIILSVFAGIAYGIVKTRRY
jgi:hypothetical protein